MEESPVGPELNTEMIDTTLGLGERTVHVMGRAESLILVWFVSAWTAADVRRWSRPAGNLVVFAVPVVWCIRCQHTDWWGPVNTTAKPVPG